MVKNEMMSSVVLSNLYVLLILLSPSSSQDHNIITKLDVPYALSTPQNISNLDIPQDISKFSNLNSLKDLNILQDISKLNFSQDLLTLLSVEDIIELSFLQDYSQSTSNLNILIDIILKVGLPRIASDMPVPDLNEEMIKKVWFTKIKVKVTTEGGHVTDLRSLRRQGDTTLTKDGDILRLQTILGFENLAVIFPHYTVEVLHIKIRGAMEAVVKDNQFLLDFGLKKNEKECKLLFNSFKLLKFKRIEVTMSGGRWHSLNWAWSRIVNLIINKFENNIKIQLEEKLSATISKLLADNEKKFCKLME
ncbi:hypothetical protein M8J76_001329 [Diaphorina citri]|nr:hypothetical protein M8J76_001329 [Diaphorina citri]